MKHLEVSDENYRIIKELRKELGYKHNNQVIEGLLKGSLKDKKTEPIHSEPRSNTEETSVKQEPENPFAEFEARMKKKYGYSNP